MTDDEIKKLVDNYHPNAAVLEAVSRMKLIATVGPSSSGKTSIMQAAVKISGQIHLVLGETTRSQRETEQPGVDYLFRSQAEVIEDIKQGNLIDVVVGPNGDLYGTRRQSFSQDKINTMAVVASTLNNFRKLPFKSFKSAFIVPASYELWQTCLNKQADIGHWTAEQWQGRLREAKQSYMIALEDPDIYFVLNDEIETGANRLLQIASGEVPADQELAKDVAAQNYQKLLDQLQVK